MTDEDEPGPTQAQKFGQYTSAAAREAGYDIDSPRGGGKKALAEAAGMSAASVSRMLAGITIPMPRYFGPLARALHRPLREIMIESGSADADLIDSAAAALFTPQHLTPEGAAAALGITRPENVEVFVALVENFQKQEDSPKGRSSRGVA
jgi:transcriptional regulator with XRE-family HTH domain